MTLEELKSGAKFKYGATSHYSVERSGDSWCVCQFGRYIASVSKMTSKYIYAFTYILDQEVTRRIDLSKCIDMDQISKEEYSFQKMVDEYGMGAYQD